MPRRIVSMIVLLLIGLSAAAAPQDTSTEEPAKAAANTGEAGKSSHSLYRLDFVVRELEGGKRINSREYSVWASRIRDARLRVGNRIPIVTGENQIQYQDVGIKIDCAVSDLGEKVALNTTFESSSVVVPDQMAASAGAASSKTPVLRQLMFSGVSPAPLGKPIVIATLDDVATNRRYEVEVTVTKIKMGDW
jgi:hypothetical protein